MTHNYQGSIGTFTVVDSDASPWIKNVVTLDSTEVAKRRCVIDTEVATGVSTTAQKKKQVQYNTKPIFIDILEECRAKRRVMIHNLCAYANYIMIY